MIKTLKKAVRVLDSAVDSLLLFVFLLLFLIGVYGLYDSYLVYLDANDTSILKYKPGYDSGNGETKEILDDMVAWLTIDDTNVDYPVMQGETNNDYLNKDPFGDYALSGSIFLDSRNSKDFSDDYSLVYGHHMEHGMMFGALDKYLDEEYFETHKKGTLIVDDVEYDITIFAVVEADATNEMIFAPTEVEVSETLEFVIDHALYLNKEDAANMKNKKLLGMSTCKFPDTVERTILIAYLEKR